jgi:hypothetical protein
VRDASGFEELRILRTCAFGHGEVQNPDKSKILWSYERQSHGPRMSRGAKKKAHQQIRDREFVRTGTHVVGEHETPTPKASIGSCAMWTCGVVPWANGDEKRSKKGGA